MAGSGLPGNLSAHRRATLLLSGGKDSAYVLWLMRREYPEIAIDPILVDTGFLSPYAMKNAFRAATACGLGLTVIDWYKPSFRNVLAHAFQSAKDKGCSGTVDFAEGSEIFSIGIEHTEAMNTPLMLTGLSHSQTGILADSAVHQRFARMTVLYPLAAWRPTEKEIRDTVLREGLIAKGTDSPLVSNSRLTLPMAVLDYARLGYSSFEPELCRLVREGKAPYKFWRNVFELGEHAVRKGWLNKQAHAVLAELGLSLTELLSAST